MQLRSISLLVLLFIIVVTVQSCKKAEPVKEEEQNEWYSGGKQTVFVSGSSAYSQMFNGLTSQKAELHGIGDKAFEATFNSDISQLNHGLGPIFNNQACISCHIADGRGKAPMAGEKISSLLIRLSMPGQGLYGEPTPVPNFGGQLQQNAIFGVRSEANVDVSYTETTHQMSDGETYSLRKPLYELSNPYMALPANIELSARIAMPVFGLGLLEAIDEMDIIRLSDEFDANNDGISGRPNYGYDVQSKSVKLGRFGWKAAQPSIIQQSAGAYNEDMGITSSIFPVESSHSQSQYIPSTNRYELSDSILFAVDYYIKTLAVPGRRNANDGNVKSGKTIFKQIGCASCHVPSFKTQSNMVYPELSNQTIFPYTDMLLHDMGDGLADYRPDMKASGYEWRTPPLWGIGLTAAVNGHSNFLHDGRARNFTEAIMWHGGEAAAAANSFQKLSKSEREQVLAFLKSL